MANGLFNVFRNNSLSLQTGFAAVDVVVDDLVAMFVDHADDVPNLTTDQDLADIASAARVPALASCPSLATKTVGTVAVGVFDAENTVFTALAGDASESLIVLKDTTVEATSILCGYWDTATGLPFTPNGGNATVTWSTSGIWKF